MAAQVKVMVGYGHLDSRESFQAEQGGHRWDRRVVGDLWVAEDWVFATETGHAANPRTDYGRWKQLLAAAGVRDARLHDGRHTAATVLLILGVPERTVMEIMGWSSTSMTKRYQHVTNDIRSSVAAKVGGLLWGTDGASPNDGERS